MPEQDEKKETSEESGAEEKDAEEKKKLLVKTQVEEVAPCRKKVAVEVPADEVHTRYDDAMKEFSAECIYPGFRKGRAPLTLVERKFGEDLAREVKGKLVAEAVTRALEEASISPMSMPEIDPEKVEFEKDKPLAFDFELDVKPDFDLPPYKSLKLEKPSEDPTDEEVDGYIEGMRRRSADLEVVEDEVALHDILTCDCLIASGEETLWERKEAAVGVEEGKLVGPPASVSSDFVLGSKPGETRRVEYKLGRELGEEKEGNDAVLEVTLHEIRRAKLPPLDDEFAKNVGVESVDALKDAVREQLSVQKRRAAHEELIRQARSKLIESAGFDLPERIVKEQAEALKQRVTSGFIRRGASEDRLQERTKEIEDASMRGAENMLRAYLTAEKIAQEEGIGVSEGELSGAIERIARMQGLRPEHLRRVMEQEGTLSLLESELLQQKVLEFVVDNADKGDGKEESEG